ncbi:hypothetical protein MMC31_001334 [Peltigera leucophlebia]|nr:hypothetical protein [Peltigera leucophlebia]
MAMSTPNVKAEPLFAIFVHAGAGEVCQRNERKHLQACEDAAQHAMDVLRTGGNAVAAVEAAIRSLEDNEITNAGYGSNLSLGGDVECDATVVDHYGRSGAVGAVGQICNPIKLARLVLEQSKEPMPLDLVPPNLLVGQGAIEYAFQRKMPVVPNDYLVSAVAKQRWTRWKAALEKTAKNGRRHPVRESVHGDVKYDGGPFTAKCPIDEDDHMITDTVGAIAIDSDGNIAAGSSSGGIAMKYQGRVGPAALIGIGTAVIPVSPMDPQKTCVATVVSGTGEHIATTFSAITCANRIYANQGKEMSNESASDIKVFIERNFCQHPSVLHSCSDGAIGVLGVTRTVDGIWLTFAHNTETFGLASMSSDDARPISVMSRNTKADSKVVGGGRSIKRHSTSVPFTS